VSLLAGHVIPATDATGNTTTCTTTVTKNQNHGLPFVNLRSEKRKVFD
jgi:hypothetical protein